jgi:flagellar hook protein FlgE
MNLDASASVGSNFSSAMTVYDSLGDPHILTMNFTKTAANGWDWQITVPGADVGASSPLTVANGSFTFDGSGILTGVTVANGGSSTPPAGDITGLTISSLQSGANPLTFDWNLTNSGSQLISQVAGASAVSATHQDGFSSGTLVNFNIGGDGTINGIFSNGRTASLGQIALATFPNNDGLLRTGNGGFLPTLASGATSVGVPGTGGRGTLSGGALELSNVDIASEFSRLILAQRGFQANARTVTTFDEVTQEAINLKR